MRWTQELYPGLSLAFLVFLLSGIPAWFFLEAPALRLAAGLLAAAALAVMCLLLVFFRDPERSSPAAAEKILSPADGRVMTVARVLEHEYFRGPALRIAIFMHIGNVHVQRLPGAGKLLWTRWRPGKYLPAFRREAARENEQHWYAFENNGRRFAVVQIAGLLARRTISRVTVGREYARGERLGMIAFGSEVDLYLPPETIVQVKPGDRVRGGKTILGAWTDASH